MNLFCCGSATLLEIVENYSGNIKMSSVNQFKFNQFKCQPV